MDDTNGAARYVNVESVVEKGGVFDKLIVLVQYLALECKRCFKLSRVLLYIQFLVLDILIFSSIVEKSTVGHHSPS